MDLLLDTQAFLWFSEDNPKLSKNAKQLIENNDNSCFISIASLWEIAIKVSLKKLKIKNGYGNLLNELEIYDFQLLPIKFEHTIKIVDMKFIHRDPFDRIIAAQSLTDGLELISIDEVFDKYGLKRIW